MLSVVPNIVFVPNIMQNTERKQRTQDANTAHFRTRQAPLMLPKSNKLIGAPTDW